MLKKSVRKSKKEIDLYADLEKIKSALGDTAYDVKGKVESLIEQSLENARDTTSDFQDSVIEYIQERPLQSVGYSLLTGIVIGWMLHK